MASYGAVTGSYFETMGIPVIRGRVFDERDARSGSHVAVISQALARRRFAERDPIGQRIEFGNMDGDLQPLTVVGVVGDVRQNSLEDSPEPILYVNLRQRPQKTPTLTAVLRVDGDLAAVMASAREVVRSIDPALPPRFRRVEQIVSESLAARRFSLTLLALFGSLALLLATSGIASITAFAVARRRPELGIRLALGARPSALLRMVVAAPFADHRGRRRRRPRCGPGPRAPPALAAFRGRALGPLELRRGARRSRSRRPARLRRARPADHPHRSERSPPGRVSVFDAA